MYRAIHSPKLQGALRELLRQRMLNNATVTHVLTAGALSNIAFTDTKARDAISSASSLTVGAGGSSLGFTGVTPIALQAIDLNADTSGSGLQTTINDVIQKLHNLGLVSINI